MRFENFSKLISDLFFLACQTIKINTLGIAKHKKIVYNEKDVNY